MVRQVSHGQPVILSIPPLFCQHYHQILHSLQTPYHITSHAAEKTLPASLAHHPSPTPVLLLNTTAKLSGTLVIRPRRQYRGYKLTWRAP